MAHQHPDKRQLPIRDDAGAAFAIRDEMDSPAGKRKRMEHQKLETDAIIASLVDTVDKLHAERVAQNAAFLKVLADRDATITALRAQLTARDAAVMRLEENCDALGALVAARKLDIADLMQEIAALQAQLAHATRDNGQLQQRAVPAESRLNLTTLSDVEFERRRDEMDRELPRRARNSVSPKLRLECFLQIAGASKGRWIRELTAKSRPSGHDFEEILLYAIEEAAAGIFFPFKLKSRVDMVNPPPLRIASWDAPQQLLEDVLYMSPHNAVGVDFFVIHSGTCHAIQVKHHSNEYLITNKDIEKFNDWIKLAQPLIASVTRRPEFCLHFWGTNGCSRYQNVDARRVNCWSGVDRDLAASVHSAVAPLLGHLSVDDLGIWENLFRAATGRSLRTTTPTTRPFSNGGTFPVFDREGRLLPTSTDGKFVFVFFRDVVVQLPIDHFRNGGNVVFQ